MYTTKRITAQHLNTARVINTFISNIYVIYRYNATHFLQNLNTRALQIYLF